MKNQINAGYITKSKEDIGLCKKDLYACKSGMLPEDIDKEINKVINNEL